MNWPEYIHWRELEHHGLGWDERRRLERAGALLNVRLHSTEYYRVLDYEAFMAALAAARLRRVA